MTRRASMMTVFVALAVALVGPAQAQEPAGPASDPQATMDAWARAMTPGPQHAALAKMVGEFKLTVKSYMEPGAEPMVSTVSASRKMIMGGRYLEETVQGSFMDQPFEGRGLTGYDNLTGRWWGMWVDSMSTALMTSWGEWDEASGVGTFWGEFTDPVTGELQKSRSVMTRLDGGNELMESFIVTPQGETKSMEILYERQ